MESDYDVCDSDDYCSEEVENSDSLDVIEDGLNEFADLSLKEKNFTVFRVEDIRRLQEDAIADTAGVLGVSREVALKILVHHKWRINNVHDRWFVDQERVCEAVGLLENPFVSSSFNRGFLESSFSGSKKFFCKICLENFPMDKRISVACGHPFCEECWKTYITISVQDGVDSLMLKCPEPSCGAAIGQDMVEKLAPDEDRAKYSYYLVQSYVQGNKKMKWCPAPGCENAIEFVLGSENYDVTCTCSYSFCWNCTEAAHRPVDCATVSKWLLKNSSESENINWILVNSKPCPNCKRPIEKNQGCMHMTCRMCKHQFCWSCLDSWAKHCAATGGYYSCNSYTTQVIEGKFSEEEMRREYAKNSLEKYLHYYERWDSNKRAISKARMELKDMKDYSLEKIRAEYSQPEAQVTFILQAWEQIIECRRVLKWTYAYGYYLPEEEKIKKKFFEYLQGEAEAALEKLHHCTEKEISCLGAAKGCSNVSSFEEFREKLVRLTMVTKKYFQNLVKAIEDGLEDVQTLHHYT